jgi:DNA recombination protein RmuC
VADQNRIRCKLKPLKLLFPFVIARPEWKGRLNAHRMNIAQNQLPLQPAKPMVFAIAWPFWVVVFVSVGPARHKYGVHANYYTRWYNSVMLVAVILLGLLVLALGAAMLALVVRNPKPATPDNSALLIKEDLTKLSGDITRLQDGLQRQLAEQLGTNSKQMAAQFASSAKIIKDVTEKLTELDRTNKNVGDIASELKTLQNVLQNPKQRGVLGEYYLEQILKNILPPGAFTLQLKLGEGLVVDAAIRYEDRWLPVDSKFSLENYNRMIEAEGEERERYEKLFKADIKGRIDETAKYVRPGKGTLDQALMFIPSETIYYDILTERVGLSGRNLLAYASEKKVTIVGPTTLSAILQTIVQGLRSMQIHKDTELIRKNIEQLGKHLMTHNTYMQKLGSSLGTTVGHFNSTYKELGKINKDIVKITDKAPDVEPVLLEKPMLDED